VLTFVILVQVFYDSLSSSVAVLAATIKYKFIDHQ